MFQFFPVFAFYIQSLTDETLRIGDLRDPADADLADGLSISVYRNSESESIKQQGFKTQYRLKIDFNYTIAIFSRNDEAQCNQYASLFLDSLKPGVDVHVLDYDGKNYAMYLGDIKDEVLYKQETNFWNETLTVSGFVYSKLI